MAIKNIKNKIASLEKVIKRMEKKIGDNPLVHGKGCSAQSLPVRVALAKALDTVEK
jgi:ribosomal protein S9